MKCPTFSALVCKARYFSHCVCIGARVYLDICIVWGHSIASLLPTIPIICPRSYLLFLDERRTALLPLSKEEKALSIVI